MINAKTTSPFLTRLTALWALSESGLGGMLHALHLPVTGFFLGAFAVIIITMIAAHSNNPSSSILHATLLVLIVKAIASPQSPPTAYVAVAFQGLLGAGIFKLFAVTKVSAMLFGALALVESAIQKLLMLTLVFGKSMWQALDLFFNGLQKDFRLGTDASMLSYAVGLYVAAYILWGAWVGYKAATFPKFFQERAKEILEASRNLSLRIDKGEPKRGKKPYQKMWWLAILLGGMLLIFLWQGQQHKVLFLLLRTLAALLLLFFVINPLLKWAINKWLRKKEAGKQVEIQQLMQLMPQLRSYVAPASQLAKQQHTGWRRQVAFIQNWMVLSLYHQDET